jgi:hypothetical protein
MHRRYSLINKSVFAAIAQNDRSGFPSGTKMSSMLTRFQRFSEYGVRFQHLKGLSHEMNLAFDGMDG